VPASSVPKDNVNNHTEVLVMMEIRDHVVLPVCEDRQLIPDIRFSAKMGLAGNRGAQMTTVSKGRHHRRSGETNNLKH